MEGVVYCSKISLSPDKWEQVEFHIRKETDGGRAKKRVVSLPRVRQCGHKSFNAFTHGRFSKTYVKYAADAVTREVFGDEAADGVQTLRTAYAAMQSQWKDGTLFVLTAVAAFSKRHEYTFYRAAKVQEKCPDVIAAAHLYESVVMSMEKF